MQVVCSTMLVLSPLIVLFLIYNSWKRIQETGSLVMREEYRRAENGNLLGPGLIFDVEQQVLSIKNKADLPFAEIRGIFIETLTSRRVGVGILLANGGELLLSAVTNNDMKVAAQDAGLIAEVVANQGERFAQAARNHAWTQAQVGTRFEFRF